MAWVEAIRKGVEELAEICRASELVYEAEEAGDQKAAERYRAKYRELVNGTAK